MILHLGGVHAVARKDVIGVFDLEITSQSATTRDFLRQAQQEGRVQPVGEDLPRSFVLTDDLGEWQIYLASASTNALKHRFERPIDQRDQRDAGLED